MSSMTPHPNPLTARGEREPSASEAGEGVRPNLLFLFSDQHARRVAGCYSDTTGTTPNLDRLASEGVVFDNVYCPSPLCVPSRMAMLTARHPYEQECWTNDDYLRSDAPTWVHGVGAAGYRPVLAGRLHSMGPDQLHGYAERMVGDHSPNWGGVPRHDLGVLDKANDPWPESLARSGIGQSAYQVKDAETASAACAFLRNVAKQREAGNDDPFCLTVGFLLPHPPYVAWREDYVRFDSRVPPAANAGPPSDVHPWEAWWRSDRGIGDVAPSVAMRARTAYYGLVHRLDTMIGDILQCLRDCRLDDNTLVVYTADHGDQLGERGLWWKHTLFEDSVRVPLIMRCPGRTLGQRRGVFLRLQRVCNYMESNSDLDLGIAGFARVANYSPCHFLRTFNTVYGKTPHAVLIEQRLKRALRLVNDTALSITEVAHASGFEDRCAFSRSFKRRYGETASAVRERRLAAAAVGE